MYNNISGTKIKSHTKILVVHVDAVDLYTKILMGQKLSDHPVTP
jgi:hypothetical protein